MRAPKIERVPESDRLGEMPHPRETDRLFGHAAAETALLEAYRSSRLPQAWIIGGREGIGKASLAWRFARFLLAHPRASDAAAASDLSVVADHPVARKVASLSHANVFLLRREWNDKARPGRHFTEIRVDEVRRATQMFRQAAAEDGYRICILDAAEDLNRNAANALLKIVEEPPPRSVFLIVSHRPGAIVPTIRSRCRLLTLLPLDADEVADAAGQALANRQVDRSAIRVAAQRSGGSVRDALQLLDGDASTLHDLVDRTLKNLPRVDWSSVHRIADVVTARDAEHEYDSLLGTVFDWLDAVVTAGAGQGPRRLAPFAQVWEKLSRAARETEALNLDKRPLVLQLFADLAAATRMGEARVLGEA